MIKRVIYFCCLLLIFSCKKNKGGGDSIDDIIVEVPTLKEPTNQFVCLDHENIQFAWDKSNEAKTYQIEIATDSQFSAIVKSKNAISTINTTMSLQKATTYYWRVKAVGEEAESEYSSVFQFYTQGDAVTNHLPKTPTIISPEHEEEVSGTSLNLQWDGSDVDAGDVLVFDVYLGTDVDNLVLVSEEQSLKDYTATVSAATTYYWRIAAKDTNGGVALSPIKNFNVQ
ncbi:glycoside hydrolase family 78 protein [Wenyingzhuangia sp. IMCC45574]